MRRRYPQRACWTESGLSTGFPVRENKFATYSGHNLNARIRKQGAGVTNSYHGALLSQLRGAGPIGHLAIPSRPGTGVTSAGSTTVQGNTVAALPLH